MTPNVSRSTRPPPQYTAEEWRLATLVHSAIAGVSLAATVELANAQILSNGLLIASVLFALALPSSVSSVVTLLYFQARESAQLGEAAVKHPVGSRIGSLLALLAQVAGFGGVLMLFWHLHWLAGIAFVSTSVIAIMTLATLGRK